MPGGARPNAGRKADWFREACADIINQERLIEFVGRVASGKETEERVVSNKMGGHELLRVACDTQTRLSAFKMLAEWGVGKPIQYVANAPRSPDESVRNVQQMLELVKAASARPPIVVPDAAAAKAMGEGNGIGANGHH